MTPRLGESPPWPSVNDIDEQLAIDPLPPPFDQRRPDIFIVGAAKAATTALANFLGQHPEVFMAEPKEPNFLNRDLTFGRGQRDIHDYAACFANWKGERRAGEGSVWYLLSQVAAGNIARFSPEAQIVILLRNPVDMLAAHYQEIRYNGHEDQADLRGALAAEPRRRHGHDLPRVWNIRETLYYREVVRLAEQVERYLDTFGDERVEILLFDDMKADTPRAYKQVAKFLNLDPLFRPQFKVVNARKDLRSRKLVYLLKDPPPWLRRGAEMLLPKPVRRPVLDGLWWLNGKLNTRRPSATVMDETLRHSLTLELSGEIDRLSRLIGRDLSAWKQV